jgi:hypothetical protein
MSTPKTNFNPVFGDYCRTFTYQSEIAGVSTEQYIEAYCSDPTAGLWTVTNIATIEVDGQKGRKITPLKEGVPFTDVLTVLYQNEAMWSDATFEHKLVEKSVKETGQHHFKILASKEGFIFDSLDIPRLRPNALGLPQGQFTDKSLKEASQYYDPANFGKHYTTLVARGVLGELFNKSHNAGVNISVKDLEKFSSQLAIERQVLNKLGTVQNNLGEYIRTYVRGQRGSLILDSLELLEGKKGFLGSTRGSAVEDLEKLRALGYPATDVIEQKIIEMKACIKIIHARCLYAMATIHDPANKNGNMSQMRDALFEAATYLKDVKNNSLPTKVEELEKLIVSLQSDKIIVPEALNSWIKLSDDRVKRIQEMIKAGQAVNIQPGVIVMTPEAPAKTTKSTP